MINTEENYPEIIHDIKIALLNLFDFVYPTINISTVIFFSRQEVTEYNIPFMTESLRQQLLELYLYRIDPYPYYYEPVPKMMMPMPRPPLPRELQENRPRKFQFLDLFNSLRSEDPKFEFCCTHPRTNWDHNNVFR